MRLSHPLPVRTARCLAGLVVLDALYFALAARHVYPRFDDVRLHFGLLAWGALALALASRVEGPPARYGACVGALAYAVFNGTELAIRPDWRVRHAALDLLWGTCACAAVATLDARWM